MALGLAILQAIAYCSELRDAYGKTEVLLYFQISLLALIVMCLIYMIFGCLSILKGQNDKVLLIN